MSLLARVLTFVIEVLLGLLVASALIGLSLGVMRAAGRPMGRPAFDVVTVLAITGCVAGMVLRYGGSLRGPRRPPGPGR